MARFLNPSRLAIVGISLLLLGFVYDIFFAGLPYQDPSQELYASWKFHGTVATWIRFSGFFVILLSIAIFISRKLNIQIFKD